MRYLAHGSHIRRLVRLSLLASPLTLGLTACGDGSNGVTGPITGTTAQFSVGYSGDGQTVNGIFLYVSDRTKNEVPPDPLQLWSDVRGEGGEVRLVHRVLPDVLLGGEIAERAMKPHPVDTQVRKADSHPIPHPHAIPHTATRGGTPCGRVPPRAKCPLVGSSG